MEQKIVLHVYPLPEAILFVRILYILSIMVRAPIFAVCFLVITMTSLAQYSLGSLKVLDFTIYPDGTTHVFYQTDVDPQSPDVIVKLFGNMTDNFVVQDENGTLLSSKINAGSADIQTLGASSIKIDYDTPDLVAKIGKTWTFHVDSPLDYSILLPKNTVIVGMSTYPLNMQIEDNQSLISLPHGPADINYVFGVLGTNQTASTAIEKAQELINKINSEQIKTPLASAKLANATTAFNEGKFSTAEVLANEAKNIAIQEEQAALSGSPSNSSGGLDVTIVLTVIIGAIAASVATVVVLIKRKSYSRTLESLPKNENYVAPDKETVFRLKPDLRQEDKDIVTFISEKGGQAFESELRKKFLLPRTTTWRAVKRLEREGIIEIEKVDQQNLIKLRKIEGDNQ